MRAFKLTLISVALTLTLGLISPAQVNAARNVTVNGTTELNTAITNLLPGDTITLNPGTYTNYFRITESKSGTAAAPILIKPNGHVKVTGGFFISASYVTVRDLEITNPSWVIDAAGFDVYGNHVNIINNIVHDICNSIGIAAFYSKADGLGYSQYFYGNIIYGNGCNPQADPNDGHIRHPHNIYTENDIDYFGTPKIYENNLIMEAGCPPSGGCYSLHVYGETGQTITGLQLTENIFSGARNIVGGADIIADKNTFTNNVFLNSSLDFGLPFFGPYTPAHGITLTGNSFWNTTNTWLLNSGGLVLQNNKFSGGATNIKTSPTGSAFSASSISGNVFASGFTQTINSTNTSTLASSGTVSSAPTIIQNKYDATMFYVAVPVAGTVSIPGSLKVYNPKDFYGSSVATGTNSVNLAVGVYVVRATAVANPPPQPPKPPACKGDYNASGTVDLADFATFGQNYKKTGISCTLDITGGNCFLDVSDFQLFASVYKQTNACI